MDRIFDPFVDGMTAFADGMGTLFGGAPVSRARPLWHNTSPPPGQSPEPNVWRWEPPRKETYYVGDPPPGTHIEMRIVPDNPPKRVPAMRAEEI